MKQTLSCKAYEAEQNRENEIVILYDLFKRSNNITIVLRDFNVPSNPKVVNFNSIYISEDENKEPYVDEVRKYRNDVCAVYCPASQVNPKYIEIMNNFLNQGIHRNCEDCIHVFKYRLSGECYKVFQKYERNPKNNV